MITYFINGYGVKNARTRWPDVQSTVRLLLGKGVAVHVQGLGVMAKGAGELILAVLAQVADMERQRIAERTADGRQVARESIARTGLTHRGKESLGRPVKTDAGEVVRWRREARASLAKTAEHWSALTGYRQALLRSLKIGCVNLDKPASGF